MLNYVEYPSSVKEGTETPGAFDQNGQRFYVLDRLQEQVSRIRYLLDTTVFFRNQLETCQAAGNAEAAQSAYLSLSSGRIGIANGVRSLKPLLLELEHPAASICEALVNQISSFELMTRDYSKFSGGISRFLDALPSYHTVDASTIGRLMNHVKLGHYPTDLTHVGYLERGIVFPDKTVNLLDPCCGTGDAVLRLALGHDSRCYDNLEADPNVDALSCCQDAQELFALYQTCASRRQIDTLLQNYLDTMQAVKAARGRIYFIPRDYMPKLALFEDFIALLEQHNQHKYADRLPLDANSMFVVDDEKQRSKMALAFYRTIQKDLAEYEKRATHLIQSGNQSPAIMDRMVLSIRELERKKIYYESILKQELHEVDEQYTSFRYLSDELQIRARSIQAQKRLAA